MSFARFVMRVALAVAFLAFGIGATQRLAFAKPVPSPLPTPEAVNSASPAPGTTASPEPSTTPLPIGSSSPSPFVSPAAATPTPRLRGLRLTTSASATLAGQSTSGGGQIGPEAPGFIAGAALAPNTPYDLFSSAPQVPGFVGIGTILTTATYRTRAFDFAVTPGLGSVRGSITNASYWGENLLPTLNPHLGSQALPYRVAFPSHAGEDDGTGVRLSLLSGSVATADGNLRVRGGYFDLAQTARFVFAQPLLTNVNPAIAYAPPETLSSGLPGSDLWQPYATALPLHGVDVVAKRGTATLEVTNAALPSLPGEAARMTMGSLVFDRGEGTTFTAQVLHATTSGLPFVTTVPFGTNPAFTPFPQGVLPTSTLDGQQQMIAGLRATFHISPALGLDGVAQVGRSWYHAEPVDRPGTEVPGGYYQLSFVKTQGRSTASVDLLRMEPRYATMILPYGVAENQWSTSFAWPGQWLKSNYQLIDNSVLGVNRQGYRLRYFIDKGPLEVHAEYTDLRQIEEETTQTSTQAGYVDGFYLPQVPNAATFGRQKRFALWTAWHPRFGDLTLDIVDDELFRPFLASHPEDRVSYEVPQAVVTYSRHISRAIVAATGLGRYAMKGAFSEPIDFAERLYFAGIEIQQTPKSVILLSFRRTAFGGIATFPSSTRSPNFTGNTFIVEQRVQL